jgi:arabinogalactan endo-1,4-beta-galactosidase
MKLVQLSVCISFLAICQWAKNADGFVTGADPSWVSQQEKNGITFSNSAGQKTDLFVLLKSMKINAVRLRVWVNPSGGW